MGSVGVACGRAAWARLMDTSGWVGGWTGWHLALLLHGAENTVVVFVHTISRRGMVMIELVFID